MNWWAAHRIRGIPQIPLFAITLLTILLAIIRREPASALALAGSVAFLLFHVSLLLPQARYALPAWMLWYPAVALLPASIAGFVSQRRAPPPGSQRDHDETRDASAPAD